MELGCLLSGKRDFFPKMSFFLVLPMKTYNPNKECCVEIEVNVVFEVKEKSM